MTRETIVEFAATVFASVGLLTPVIILIYFTLAQDIVSGVAKKELERYVVFIVSQMINFIPKQTHKRIVKILREYKDVINANKDRENKWVIDSNKTFIQLSITMGTVMFVSCITISVLLWFFIYRFPLGPFLFTVLGGTALVIGVEILMLVYMTGKIKPLDVHKISRDILDYAKQMSSGVSNVVSTKPEIIMTDTGISIEGIPINITESGIEIPSQTISASPTTSITTSNVSTSGSTPNVVVQTIGPNGTSVTYTSPSSTTQATNGTSVTYTSPSSTTQATNVPINIA